MNNVIAFIPARGGSKGIPGKNIMNLAGKPAIAWSIEHALESKFISKVIVSTDDKKIAKVSKEWGAEVPFMRPSKISGDLATDFEAFEHYLKYLADSNQPYPDLIVHLRASGPVRDVEVVDKAISLMLNNSQADALRSMSRPMQTPFKMWRVEKGEFAQPLLEIDGMKDPQSSPRQILPEVYWQNGYVDIVRPRAILKNGTMWGKNLIPFIIEEELLELDYPENIPDVENALESIKKGKDSTKKESKKRHSV